MKKKIYIIRHGETDLNKKGIVQGKGVNSPLNAHGQRQAEAFYQAFKQIPFDKIYTSTLLRTHQTVSRFIDKGLPWEQLSGLDEISWGIYEGKDQSPELIAGFNAITNAWKAGEYDLAIEQGESPRQVETRLRQAMDHIVNDEDSNDLSLICMHGRVLRLLLCILTGKPLSQMEEFPHTNTALYVIDYENGHFEVVDFYNVQHLEQIQSLP